MFDHSKIDSYFTATPQPSIKHSVEQKHTKIVRITKLLLPALAATLVGLLVLVPYLKQDEYNITISITKPKAGELEKLHVENSIFNITDKNNQVHHFTAQSIDETSPGSKLVKLTNPEGTMPAENQQWINIKSPYGYFNQNTNDLRLEEGVEMFYSEGMNLNLKDINFNFDTQYAHSNSPVSGQGIFGAIQAEGFEYYKKDALLIFTGKSNITIREESFKSRK